MIEVLEGGTFYIGQALQDLFDDIIAAANKVSEGAPVDTIARRPDGAWIAHRVTPTDWRYTPLHPVREWPEQSAADSWPVIYDPDEYHEGDKPRLERLMREPSVFDADEVEVLAKWLSIHVGTWPEDEWELRSKPNYYHDRAQELLEFGYRKVYDPTANYSCDTPTKVDEPEAQQEPPKGLYGKYRVERVDGKPIRACFVLEYLDDLHANKALLEYAFSVERVNPELAKDLRTEWGKWPGRSQQEPEGCAIGLDGECEGKCQTQKPPRTPRVVDRLGVDERGSRWRNRAGLEFRHDGTRWVSSPFNDWYGEDYEPDALPPYTEVLEPRVLPTLDCPEARDGTVWQAAFSQTTHGRGWKFWYMLAERKWYTDGGYDEGVRLGVPDFLTERGPYTEVLDVG